MKEHVCGLYILIYLRFSLMSVVLLVLINKVSIWIHVFFCRAGIHLRLGSIYKQLHNYSSSLEYLQRALTDPTSGCLLKTLELIYEKLLTLKFEGIILRQLGWLYFYPDKSNCDREI